MLLTFTFQIRLQLYSIFTINANLFSNIFQSTVLIVSEYLMDGVVLMTHCPAMKHILPVLIGSLALLQRVSLQNIIKIDFKLIFNILFFHSKERLRRFAQNLVSGSEMRKTTELGQTILIALTKMIMRY